VESVQDGRSNDAKGFSLEAGSIARRWRRARRWPGMERALPPPEQGAPQKLSSGNAREPSLQRGAIATRCARAVSRPSPSARETEPCRAPSPHRGRGQGEGAPWKLVGRSYTGEDRDGHEQGDEYAGQQRVRLMRGCASRLGRGKEIPDLLLGA